MICCPFMGTPALERLWQTWKCSQLVTVYSTFRVCNPISTHTYRTPHLLSKSESQVDDYPVFIYKEPSAFPTVNCYRSQVVQVADLVSKIKELLRKQVRLQAV